MTISYHSGGRIQGTSTDTPAASADYTDDFETDDGSWNETGGFHGHLGSTLYGKLYRNSTNHGSYYDLGAGNVSDDAWVLRFKLNIVSLPSGTNNSIALYLSDSTVVGINANKSAIGLGLQNDGGASFKLVAPQNSYSFDGASAFGTPSTNSPDYYYVEIKRTSSTKADCRLYSDSNYTTLDSSTTDHTISSSITGLRYLVVQGMNDGGSSAGYFWEIGIDSIEFYDGVTSKPTATSGYNSATNVPDGSRFEETDTRKIYTKGTYGWTEMGTAPESRGVWGGGDDGSATDVIDYINIVTLGNATDFGNLTSARDGVAGCASSTRGVFAGGASESNVMDYITFATIGNATDFGDLSLGRRTFSGTASETRGVFGGGNSNADSHDVTIDYITISTTGNATDFGDLTEGRRDLATATDKTKAVFGGGWISSSLNTIDYVTIASTGNATDFGDLTTVRGNLGGNVNSTTRGVFGGGYVTGTSNVMDYITIATTGNATDFGDLSVTRTYLDGLSSNTRGIFGGGTSSNVMDYITIDTIGNATDFGDLTVTRGGLAGVDDA